ncbi:MAG: hypothetical protein WCX71_01670 [Candidatus Buchananbacteria bacterium]
MAKEVIDMETGNIIKGKIRRLIAVEGRPLERRDDEIATMIARKEAASIITQPPVPAPDGEGDDTFPF